jgi:hypothetical protein
VRNVNIYCNRNRVVAASVVATEAILDAATSTGGSRVVPARSRHASTPGKPRLRCYVWLWSDMVTVMPTTVTSFVQLQAWKTIDLLGPAAHRWLSRISRSTEHDVRTLHA